MNNLITGNTKVVSFIAHDASYSLSPRMHNSGLAAVGLFGEYVYTGQSVAPENLSAAIKGLAALGNYRGASIGVPHKVEIMPHLHTIDPAAQAIGAVNTVVIDRTTELPKLFGYNTDYLGILKPLEEKTDLANKKVAIIGAGGAARAAVYAMISKKAQVTIFNRTSDKAQVLAQEFDCQATPLSDLSAGDFDIILQATNQGMHQEDGQLIDPENLHKDQVVFDFVYSKEQPITPLLLAAKNRGAIIIPGIEMLLYQGIAQFELFFQTKAPIDVMRKALTQ